MAFLSFAPDAASVVGHATVVEHSIVASATGPVVVAIGDSIMEGHGVGPDQAWLAVLAREDGWRFTNLASDGSGFVTVGDNGDTFSDQAAVAESLHPDVIILAGSSNDLGVDDATLDRATTAMIDRLHAALPGTQIIAVSAIWGDTVPPGQMNTIDDDVAGAVTAVGGQYVDVGQPLSDRPDLMQGDDVHPTVSGQHVFAWAIDQAATADGVTL
jgi:acyl-CoA thioesterase-1